MGEERDPQLGSNTTSNFSGRQERGRPTRTPGLLALQASLTLQVTVTLTITVISLCIGTGRIDPPPPTSPDVYRPNPPRERQRLPSPPRYSSRRAPGAEIRRDRPQPSTSAPALRRTSCHSNLSSIPEEAEDQPDSGGEGDEECTPRRGQGRGGRRKSIDAETRHRRELRRQERDAAACQGLAHDSSTTEAEESDGEAREWDETFRTAQEEPQSSGDGEAGSGDEDDSSDC